MKVVIPSGRRHDTIRTHRMFPKAVIVVHTEEDRALYAKNPTLAGHEILVSNMPRSIGAQRQWILDNLAGEGEWILMLDDNLNGFEALPEAAYAGEYLEDLTVQDVPLDQERLRNVLEETMWKAVGLRVNLCGFRLVNNPFFFRKKWSTVGYVCARAMLIRKTEVRFDPELSMREEVQFFLDHYIRDGRVLINKWVLPAKKHYEAGGIGSLNERLKRRAEESRMLMQKYPGVLRYKEEETDVTIALHTEPQIEKWRTWMFATARA